VDSTDRRERAALERWKPGVRWYHPLLASIVIGTSRFVMTRLNRLEVDGIERFRSVQDRGGRGLLTYSNHVSLFDDPLIVANLVSGRYEAIRWVGADAINFFGNRAKSWLFTAGKCVPIIRGTGLDQPGIWFLADRLKQGDWVHFFPEGTRTRDRRGHLGDSCKPGIGLLIEQAKPMTLPFYHAGMHDVLPVGAITPRRGNTVRVLFGQATDCDEQYVKGVATSRTGPISGRDLWQALADAAHSELLALEHAVAGASELS
jgi:monolysocardiolipin acyltransferase